MLIKNNKYLITTILSIYTILFLHFEPPWGLMDDYRFIYLIPELFKDFLFVSFEIVTTRAFDRGMLQPFFVLEKFIQYLPGYLTKPYISYIFNLFIIFLCHLYFYKGVSRFIKIRYSSSILIFFIWPFTNDLLFLISLEEKLIFLLGGLLIYKIKENSNNLIIFFSTFFLPLIKLQGSIFLFIFIAIYLIEKKKIWLVGIYGLVCGVLLQAYFIFFNQGDYFVYNSSFEKLFNNFLAREHILIFFIILFLFFVINKKEKNEQIFIFGLVVSLFSLIFIYSNWNLYGYLFATYSFFLSMILPIFEISILSKFNKAYLKEITSILLLISLVFSMFVFFLPRAERWSDLNSTIEQLSQDTSKKIIYYCGTEGTRWLSELNLIHEFKFIPNPSDISEKDFFLIKDDYNCNYFTDTLVEYCYLTKFPSYQNYERFYLLYANCIKS